MMKRFPGMAACATMLALAACSNEAAEPSSDAAPTASAQDRLTAALERDAGYDAAGFAFDGAIEISVDAGPERFRILSDVAFEPAADGPGQWRASGQRVEVTGSKSEDPDLQAKALSVFQAALNAELAEIGGYDPALVELAVDAAETPPGSGVYEYGLNLEAIPEGPARERYADTVFAATVRRGCMEGAASEYQVARAEDDAGPVLRRRVFSYECPADGPAYAKRSEITQIDRAEDGELHTTRVTLTVNEAAYALTRADAAPPAGR